MFKNWFRGFRKGSESLDVTEEKIIEQSVCQNESKKSTIQKGDTSETQKDLASNLKQQEQTGHEKVEIAENLNSNKEFQVEKKPKHKAAKKFARYKILYKDKFRDCKNINEVFEVYIKYTDYDDLLDELRLRYISMYLFNTRLTNDRWSITQVKYTLNEFLSRDSKIEESVLEDDTVNEKLYIQLKAYIEDQIPVFQQSKTNINMDGILLSVFSEYGMESIDSDFFLEVLLKVIDDMDLPKVGIKRDDFRDYLKQRILNTKDTQFWKEDEEKIYRCEVTFMARCIEIKTRDFIHIAQKLEEGPIYVGAIPLERYNLFSVYIGDTLFIMNPYDKNRTLSYYEYINNEILEEVNKKIEIINKEISTASSELNEMIKNFLNIMPLNILLDIEYYIAFEHLISFNNFIAKQFLDSNTEQRNVIVDKLKEDVTFYDTLNDFIDGNYAKLVKITGKYINLPKKYHSSVIWKLIRESSVQFISEYWNNEYGIYFEEDIQIITLDEYVDLYCRCLDIPTKNVVTAGAFTYYLMGKDMFPAEVSGNFIECNFYLIDKILQKFEELELEEFENRLTNTQVQKNVIYTINDVDLMNGYEFEQFVSLLFMKMGYMTEMTKGSGDQGMDVIAERNGIKIGIQAKCYSTKVTNKAVQEIFAALNYYDCHKGMVITNNYFTDSALELAESNNIVLWDRDILKIKIEEIF